MEDYAYLDIPSRRSGEWWEPLKRIPLADGLILETGLELRARVESYGNNLWGSAPAPDDAYLWTRALPVASVRTGSVRAFVQLGATFASGVRPRETSIDQSGLEAVQGFAEYSSHTGGDGAAKFTARIGRMLLSLGSERLVGTRYGPNTTQSFDAAIGILDAGRQWRVQAFYARPVDVSVRDFDDATSDTEEIWSVYATRRGLRLAGGSSDLDVYYIGYASDARRYQQGTGPERRHSFGARLAGKAGSWDWDGELTYQIGSVGGQDVRALGLGGSIGHTFERVPLTPRAALGGAILSGDDDPSDGRLGTFNPLFPKGRFFGEISPLGPYNLRVLQPRLTLRLGRTVTIGGGALAYWRDSVRDAIYGIPGQIVRRGDVSRARYVGLQSELIANWQPRRWLEFAASLASFEAGRFLRETGPSDTMHFAAFEMKVRY